MGNPPYSRSSQNKSAYIKKLIGSYKEAVREEKNIQPLSDDYIKFIRISQEIINKNGFGIIGMITNHTFLKE
jgi:predicted helicase